MRGKSFKLIITLVIIMGLVATTKAYFGNESGPNYNYTGERQKYIDQLDTDQIVTEEVQTSYSLQDYIDQGKSIMLIEPHPDDEIFIPGIFAMASDKGNKCYVVCIGSIENIPSSMSKDARRQVINWFEEKYLEEYIILDNYFDKITSQIARQIKPQLINVIEEKKPDIIITFTYFGYYGHRDHRATSMIVSSIYNRLSYRPLLYHFVNMDQDLTKRNMYEYQKYPPTDVLDLDVYSSKLGKTYWEAKLEMWQEYSTAVPFLRNVLRDTDRIDNHDMKEYFHLKDS